MVSAALLTDTKPVENDISKKCYFDECVCEGDT